MVIVVSETMVEVLIKTMIGQGALLSVLLDKGLIDEEDLKAWETHKLRLVAEADQIKAKVMDEHKRSEE